MKREVSSALLAAATSAALAQGNVSPPQAQAWIDVATYSGLGMPMAMAGGGGGGGGGMGGLLGALGGALGGGGAARNDFGRTQVGGAGRWVDVTLSVRAQPQLREAQLAVPTGFLDSPLKLQSPPQSQSRPVPDSDDKTVEPEYERPKGKLLLYWGCGASVRQGQPRVLDFATLSPADLQKFFVARSATQRGTHAVVGRPIWPSKDDARMVPAAASLVGEYRFSGTGVPESFRFQIPPAQDLMPAIALAQKDAGGATELSWNAAPTARGWFVSGMGQGSGQNEMVLWTSSEEADTGFGLLDYQTNPSVDRWLREKVLLPAATTHCTVPRGIFAGGGAMLRLIGYGSELNLAHPPRPSDPKAAWEPQWALKVRVKSVTMGMLGMPSMAESQGGGTREESAAPAQQEEKKKVNPLDVIRGVLGR